MPQSQRRNLHIRVLCSPVTDERSTIGGNSVSGAAQSCDIRARLGLAKTTLQVNNTRKISKLDMVHNDYCPAIEVNPETYEVRADGHLLTCDPAAELPMAQRYFLF